MYEVRERIEITVPGQMTGPACLEVYGNDGGEKKRSEQKVSEQRKKAVIICPGGGYWQVVEREGAPVAKRFAQMGCQTFVLNYSVLPDGFPTSLLELARAVELVRTRADDWDVNPEQILVCGFSAGGHLACSLGVFWNRGMVYQTLGEENGENFRPNGMILAYPVITSGQFAHKKFVERLFQHSGGASEEERKYEINGRDHYVACHFAEENIRHACEQDTE